MSADKTILLQDKRKLGFAEYGKPNGFPIIYFHGSQSSRLEMHYDLTFAHNENLRIITVDRPGHGLSSLNPEGTILSFAEDIHQLADHLGLDEFSVVGMSAGSPFALGAAKQLPERVRKVAIVSGFAPLNQSTRKYLSRDVRFLLNIAAKFPFALKIMLSIQAKQLQVNPEKALQGFLKIMSSEDQQVLKDKEVMQVIEAMFKEAFRQGGSGVLHEITKILVRDWGFLCEEIVVPVTFYHGARDNNVPHEWAKIMNQKVKNSKLVEYPSEGHLIIFGHVREIFGKLK